MARDFGGSLPICRKLLRTSAGNRTVRYNPVLCYCGPAADGPRMPETKIDACAPFFLRFATASLPIVFNIHAIRPLAVTNTSRSSPTSSMVQILCGDQLREDIR